MPLLSDTHPEAARLLVERWRAMSVAERVALLDQLHADVEALALAGIRSAQPGLSEAATRRELVRRRFGAELADAAYAESR